MATHDFVGDDDVFGRTVHFMVEGEDDEDDIGYRRISRLSIESSDGNDADAEISEEEEEEDDDDDDEKVVVRKNMLASLMEEEGKDSDEDSASTGAVSLPGTPLTGRPGWFVKDYASETEALGRSGGGGGDGGRRRRRTRERWLERAWEMKKRSAEEAASPPLGPLSPLRPSRRLSPTPSPIRSSSRMHRPSRRLSPTPSPIRSSSRMHRPSRRLSPTPSPIRSSSRMHRPSRRLSPTPSPIRSSSRMHRRKNRMPRRVRTTSEAGIVTTTFAGPSSRGVVEAAPIPTLAVLAHDRHV